jgi:RNA polymerase sigma factor (sigma-70 family)
MRGTTAMSMSKEQAEGIFKDSLKYIKKAIAKKISIYEPLTLETTYGEFIAFLREDDFKALREKPNSSKVKPYLDEQIKEFLIRQAYLSLEEKYIRQRMMARLGIYNPENIKLMQIVDYIIDRLEENRLARLKKFAEKCKFKTFLSTVVSNLLYDFWRGKYADEKQETKYKDDFKNLFDPPVEDPLDVLIQIEEEELKQKAMALLPEVLDRLDTDEKLAIKLKYSKGMKILPISETLGSTHYKTKNLIGQTERKIRIVLLSEIKKGGQNDAP